MSTMLSLAAGVRYGGGKYLLLYWLDKKYLEKK
jgi:hypothetical protein